MSKQGDQPILSRFEGSVISHQRHVCRHTALAASGVLWQPSYSVMCWLRLMKSSQVVPALLLGHPCTPTGNRSVVSHFQELLLRRLLLEDTPQDLVELSAVALLPLLLSEPSAFGPLSGSIAHAAGAQGDARASQAVATALSQLGQGLEAHAAALVGTRDTAASSNSMRSATRQFRQQLCQLVADVRGLIRMR